MRKFRADCAAMQEVLQHLDSTLDHVMGFPAVYVGQEPNATGVVFVLRIV